MRFRRADGTMTEDYEAPEWLTKRRKLSFNPLFWVVLPFFVVWKICEIVICVLLPTTRKANGKPDQISRKD